ncbi:ATP-dependent Clp protease proteolytic subunit [Enterococcus cecorum]
MKIKLNGTVIDSDDAFIYEWLGIPHISSAQLNNLPTNGEDLEIELNSYGGSVFAGSEIYTILKSYPGNVIITVTGIVASVASVIAMASRCG